MQRISVSLLPFLLGTKHLGSLVQACIEATNGMASAIVAIAIAIAIAIA